jgi:GntR family transcriptional repressor for pyruvate dehydrogenase complex
MIKLRRISGSTAFEPSAAGVKGFCRRSRVCEHVLIGAFSGVNPGDSRILWTPRSEFETLWSDLGPQKEPMAATDLQPLSNVSRPDEVFERLRSRILSGAFQPGERLPTERELAAALGVNRSSVREALKHLEFLELVEVVHGQGAFVRDLSHSSALQLVETLLRDPGTVTPDLMRQILEFRRHATLQLVDLSARNRRPEHLVRARELLASESEAGADPAAALELDIAMNALLGEASGNLLYQIVTNLFTKLLRRLGPIYYNESRDHSRSHENHRELLGALDAGDSEDAQRIVRVMLDYSEAKILAAIEELDAQGMIGPGAVS